MCSEKNWCHSFWNNEFWIKVFVFEPVFPKIETEKSRKCAYNLKELFVLVVFNKIRNRNRISIETV